MAENNVDFSHFRYVHGSDGIPEDEFITEGTYKKTIGGGGNFVREGYGLGLGVLRVKGYVTFLSSTTPLDTRQRPRPLDLHLAALARRGRRPSRRPSRSAPASPRTSRSGRTRSTETRR